MKFRPRVPLGADELPGNAIALGRSEIHAQARPFFQRHAAAFLLFERLGVEGLANTLFSEPYLSTNPKHQGLLLHSVYHRPNGWDYVARGAVVPNGESSMWGDYHARELALLILREAKGEKYLTFFGCV